jgi:hypothetical protein
VQALKAPFQDGTVLAKLGCKRIRSPGFGPASMPGRATTVQFMLKDSEKYGAMGGWSFGRFIHGKPADAAQRQTCFPGHEALVKGHDFVFTRVAP